MATGSLWNKASENANDWDRETSRHLKAEQKADRKRIRHLERDLRRKEKALAEKDCILKICYKSEYASMPPVQIVPRLADKGEYIASESSFYRILHQADEHRIAGIAD